MDNAVEAIGLTIQFDKLLAVDNLSSMLIGNIVGALNKRSDNFKRLLISAL